MMSLIGFLFISTLHNHVADSTTTEMTLSVDQRIELLKREIMEEIHGVNMPPALDYAEDYFDQYQYVDLKNQPITPIPESDKRKAKDRYKQPEIISIPTERYIPSEESSADSKPLRSKKRTHKKLRFSKPREVFYRKMILDDEGRNKPQKWTHCLDLVTPLLNGLKDNMTAKQVWAHDDVVVRLAHLLSINVTDQGKDEIRSILYQISTLQIRLFQWDVNAIKILLNIIISTRVHDFKGLKHGLKAIFANWQLDTSDINSFVKQSRIFRPPCIAVAEFEGSTQSSKSMRYTKKKTKKCTETEESECST